MSLRSRLWVPLFACATVHAWSPAALATYSIVAVDQGTGKAGVAGASCVGYDIGHAFAVEPGLAVAAQAYYFDPGKLRALELLRAGLAPKVALEQITAPSFDPTAASRQYGLVSTKGAAASFTGSEVDPVSAHRVASGRGRVSAIQGNYLTSDRVVTAAEQAMLAGPEDLAESLMKALEAGASDSEGDARCRRFGIPATAAFLSTAQSGQEPLQISVVVRDGTSAIAELRRRYNASRAASGGPTDGKSASCNLQLIQLESTAALFVVLVVLVLAIIMRRSASRHP